MQSGDRLRRLGPDLVSQAERTHQHAVAQDEQPGHARRGNRGRVDQGAFGEQPWPADGHLHAIDSGGHTERRLGGETGSRRNLQFALSGRLHDRPGQRVLAVGLRRRGESQNLVGGGFRPRHGVHRNQRRPAPGEGSGLVEHDRGDGPHPLQCQPVLHQHPGTGRPLGRDRHHQRDRQPEGVRTGDHQNGDHPGDSLVGLTEQDPHHTGRRRGDQREPEQPPRSPVSEPLRTRAGTLGLLDQSADAGQDGVVAGCRDLDAQARVGAHRARGHQVTRGAMHRARLPGDHRFVQVRLALDDPSVRRHPATGTDQNEVADHKLRRRDQLHRLATHHLCGVGQERGQRVQSARGPGK